MLFESLVVSLFVHAETALSAYLFSHLYRETERVVQSESGFAVKLVALHVFQHLFYLFKSVFEGLGEALLFLSQFVDYLSRVDFEFGINVLILFDIYIRKVDQLCAVETYSLCKSYASSDKTAENVTLIDVGRNYSALVADKEGSGTDMIRDYSYRSGILFVLSVLLAAFSGYLCDDVGEKISLIRALKPVYHAYGTL